MKTVNSFHRELSRIDEELRAGKGLSPELLSGVPVEVLGEVYLGLRPEYPALMQALPSMPPAQVQRDWTGTDGKPLMAQSCAFIRDVAEAFQEQVGGSLSDATVLDYGCGWGRLLRLLLLYSRPERIWGLDPWDRSIELCREHRIPVNLAVSDYLPKSLPVGGTRFDLVFAFSVFTHLSPTCARQVMTTLRTYMNDKGLLAITVRPPDYWRIHSYLAPELTAEAMIALHRNAGFAFIPHNRAPIDGDITYGDASYSLDYIQNSWSGWVIAETTPSALDPMQTIVLLRPKLD